MRLEVDNEHLLASHASFPLIYITPFLPSSFCSSVFPPPHSSVLEPGRTLTLAERGGEGAEVIQAAPGFLLVATMNPGGDFGKKELSPALSNRFTVIWVPALEDDSELLAILQARLQGEGRRDSGTGLACCRRNVCVG